MSNEYDRLLRVGLPTVNHLYASYNNFGYGFGTPGMERPIIQGLCVVGPSVIDLERYAPYLLGLIRKSHDCPEGHEGYSPATHIPASDGDSLKRLVDAVSSAWLDDNRSPWHLLIALPSTVKCDFTIDQCALPEGLLPGLHPTLLLAACASCLDSTLAILPESALSDPAGSASRSKLGARSFQVPGASVRQERQEIRDLLRDACEAMEPDESHEPDAIRRTDLWQRPTLGLRPAFVWSHGIDDEGDFVSVACLLSPSHRAGAGSGHFPGAVHLRRLSPVAVSDLHQNRTAVERLTKVALGVTERQDDDYFVPSVHLAISGRWSLDSDRQYDPNSYVSLMDYRGHPLKRLREVAQVDSVEEWEAGADQADTIWFVSEGKPTLSSLLQTPTRPNRGGYQSGERGDEQFQQACIEFSRVRLLKLSHCEDVEYLYWLLSDEAIIMSIRCRAAKSWSNPVVSASVLRETLIPWPEAKDRASAIARIRAGRASLAELRDAVDAVSHELKRGPESAFDDRSGAQISPLNTDWPWTGVVAEYNTLSSVLHKAVPHLLPEERSRSSRSDDWMPVPLAWLERNLEQEVQASRRLKRGLDLIEWTLRFEGALLLALLCTVSPASVEQVFSVLDGKGKRVRKLSLGHWNRLQQEARKSLRKACRIRPTDVSLVTDSVLSVDEKLCLRQADNAVELRNKYHGHGSTLPPLVESEVSERIAGKARELLRTLPHLAKFPLIVVSSRKQQRQGSELSVTYWSGERLYPDSRRITKSRGLTWDKISDGELCLFYAEPDGLVTLTPWMLLGTANCDEHLFLIDEIKDRDRYVAYRSPTTHEALRRPDMASTVKRFLS